MKTVIGMFRQVIDAQNAVHKLLDKGFKSEQMNIIVQENTAKQYLDVNRQEVKVEKTGSLGKKHLEGLDNLLGGVRAIVTPDAGRVFAAGAVASTLAKSAASMNDGGLRGALNDFNVPKEIATSYRDNIANGGLLFWLRTDDSQTGTAVIIIEDNKAENVITISQSFPPLR
jgi:hypothetical protein